MATDILQFDQIRNVNSNVLNVITAINPLGFGQPTTMVRITNNSNIDVLILWGQNAIANDIVRAGEVLQLPVQQNAESTNWKALFPKGMVVYALSATGAPGVGLVWLAAYGQ